jgi:hypothetical protein
MAPEFQNTWSDSPHARHAPKDGVSEASVGREKPRASVCKRVRLAFAHLGSLALLTVVPWLGCGSDDGSDDSASPPPKAPVASPQSSPYCKAALSDDACVRCWKRACCPTYSACVGSDRCLSYIDCVSDACENSSAQSCGSSCGIVNPAGRDLWGKLKSCTIETCLDECDP